MSSVIHLTFTAQQYQTLRDIIACCELENMNGLMNAIISFDYYAIAQCPTNSFPAAINTDEKVWQRLPVITQELVTAYLQPQPRTYKLQFGLKTEESIKLVQMLRTARKLHDKNHIFYAAILNFNHMISFVPDGYQFGYVNKFNKQARVYQFDPFATYWNKCRQSLT